MVQSRITPFIEPNKIVFIFLFLGGMSNFSLKSNHLPPDTTKTTLMQLLIDLYIISYLPYFSLPLIISVSGVVLGSMICSMEKRPTAFSYTHNILFSVWLCLAAASSCASADLTLNFYSASCPSAELMVRSTVRSASNMDPTVPGKLLRLLFHDCFVEGCDASVLLQGNGTERSDPANQSLGGFSVIDSAKRLLEIFCPGTVSCADIVALAARDAVEITGGPVVQIPSGRRDGKVSSASNVRPNIVDTSFTMDEMIKLFSSKGLSLDDLVTLSGAHTIGAAHCSAFSDRFQEDSKGNFTLIDASLDNGYAEELMKQCPAGSNPSITVKNDPRTSFVFDNQYYRNLLAHRGLFQSDSILFTDSRSRKQVEHFAEDQFGFFGSWVQSFLKLTSIHVKTGDEGEIRAFCPISNA